MTNYSELSKELKLISEDVGSAVTVLSNASALLYERLEDLNWSGFYLNTGERLILGPFQGKVACTAIEFGNGVCGTAAKSDETVVVDDVHSFEGHIACDGASNSEIVVPMHVRDALFGVLDIDSPLLSRFSYDDREGLETFVSALEEIIENIYGEDPSLPDPLEIKAKTMASMGNAGLCLKLGNAYYYGESFPQIPEKAVFWYEKAASFGSAEGECLLGYCLRNGIGCEKDEHRAMGLFAIAADKGFGMAMYNLGYCFEKGIGTKANLDIAREWYEKARAAGYEE